MSDGTYTPFVNPNALLSMPVVSPDGSITHGSEPSNTAPDSSSYNLFGNILENVPIFGTAASAGAMAGTKAASTPESTTKTKNSLVDVVLVVIGLMLLSRGFGLIGEEGEGVIVQLSNPAKYPGIGHAIQHAKGKGK